MANVISKYLEKQLLVDATTHVASGSFSGALYTLVVDLFTSAVTLDADTAMADLTLAAYTGYTQGTLTLGTPFDQTDGSYAVQGGLTQFNGPSSGAGATCYGYVVHDGGSPDHLLWAEMFTSPISLNVADDAVIVGPQLVMGGDDFGSGSVIQ